MLWRTTGAWGSGLGRDLNPDEIDGNFFELAQAVDAMTAIGGVNSIDDFTVVGDQMTVHMTDHTTRGPFTLPGAAWNATGPWQALHVYSLRDTFDINGSVYEVIFAHTSAATFDAGANNGSGSDYYHLMLSSPSNALPEGGDARQVLLKVTSADYDTDWDFLAFEDLSDFAANSPFIEGDVISWDDGLNKWVNRAFSIPAPSSSALGGVQQLDAVAGYYVTGLGDDGVLETDRDLSKVTQTVADSGGVLAIDLALGHVIVATISGNVTSITVTGWPPALTHTEVLFYFFNTGAFTVTGWPSGTIWPGGTDFVITSGSSKDKVEYCSFDGGTTKLARAVGQNYLT